MKEEKSLYNKSGKNIINTILITLGAIILFLMICPLFGIRVFTVGMKGEYTDRVDCIPGYYAAVYGQDVCHYYSEDGTDILKFGYVDDITEYDWKHREVMQVVPYRRVLCFSKETEPEIYALTDEAGTVRYGIMYVLRASKDVIHYYYRRDNTDSRLEWSALLNKEKIAFSYNGEIFDLNESGFFTSAEDFTTGERILMIEGEPCYLKPLTE